ncbi:hypothetical protein [Paracidovorax citrulli]
MNSANPPISMLNRHSCPLVRHSLHIRREWPLHGGTVPWKGYRVTFVAKASGDIDAVQPGPPPSASLWQRFVYLLRSLFRLAGGKRWSLSVQERVEAYALAALMGRRRGLPAPEEVASLQPKASGPVLSVRRPQGTLPGLQLAQLPVECLRRVVRGLAYRDIVRLSRTDRQMRDVFGHYRRLLVLPAMYVASVVRVRNEDHFLALLRAVNDARMRNADKAVVLHGMAGALGRISFGDATVPRMLDVLARLSPSALMTTSADTIRARSIGAAIAYALFRQGNLESLHDAVWAKLGHLSGPVRGQIALGYVEQLHFTCLRADFPRIGMAPSIGALPAEIAAVLTALECSALPLPPEEWNALLRQACDSRWGGRVIALLLQAWISQIQDEDLLQHVRAMHRAIGYWFSVDPPRRPLLQPWSGSFRHAVGVCLVLLMTRDPEALEALFEPLASPSSEAVAQLQFAHLVVASDIASQCGKSMLRYAAAMVRRLPPDLQAAGRCLLIAHAVQDEGAIKSVVKSCERLPVSERVVVLEDMAFIVQQLPEDQRVPAAAAVLHAFLAVPLRDRPLRYAGSVLQNVMRAFLEAVPDWWWTPCPEQIADFLLGTAACLAEEDQAAMLEAIHAGIGIVPEAARSELVQRLGIMESQLHARLQP